MMAKPISPFEQPGHSFLWVLVLILFATPFRNVYSEDVSYGRDIQPILAKTCYACHGPDEENRQAELRLDERKVAVRLKVIVPGKSEESELIRRIISTDPNEKMPPPGAHESLTDDQKQQLKLWITQGAVYEPHWAFVPASKPPVPIVRNPDWARNPVDRFTLAQMEQRNLTPSQEAEKSLLVRRVYLDLIGLPPSPAEADAFINDASSNAYENLVDRLLNSKHYGERWARLWLDLARYSDTNGYEKDRPRSIWPYRDWVINALNTDMPYDEFSIKQLAGDMLPAATLNDRIATGFHRNTMLNEEGGIDPLEYRFHAMVDRVATTGTVWLGLTTGCAQCHSHKYDPISHTDYYRFMALLNNADEPEVSVFSHSNEVKRKAIQTKIEQLRSELHNQFPPIEGTGSLNDRRKESLKRHYDAWLKKSKPSAAKWETIRPNQLQSNLPRLEVLADDSIFSSGDITKRDIFRLSFPLEKNHAPITALRLEVLPDDRLPDGGPGRAYYEGRKGDFFLSELTATIDGKPVKFKSASQSYGKISIGSGNANAANVIDGKGSTGWSTAGREGQPHQLVLNCEKPLSSSGNLVEVTLLFERHFAASLGRFRFSVTSQKSDANATSMPVGIERVLAGDPNRWAKQDREKVENYFLSVTPELASAREPIEQLIKQLPSDPKTLVMQERPTDNPRKTYRHHRGEYLKHREGVKPGVPGIFPPISEDQPLNRLSLARWLVSKKNPLASRVAVNRAWRVFFGKGLVQTDGDYGTQSQRPSHPQLLDWLSCEFVEQGWSMKKLHRLIVTSATYRQSSLSTKSQFQLDPENRWLVRGPRFPVEAEMVRDMMLTASGLLTPKIGGPSVYPPQPASVTGLAYGQTAWKASQGSDRYRRSLYTFSKRTTPFAAYDVFNGPSGELCIARRNRSTTPLQALTLLNDEMFLEMARGLAVKSQKKPSRKEIAIEIFRRLLTRKPTSKELDAILAFHQRQKLRFEAGGLDAKPIMKQPQASSELAAWMLVARVVMNLNETLTRQ